MFDAKVDNIPVTCNIDITEDEARKYIEYLVTKYGRKIQNLDIHIDQEYADLSYDFVPVPFERIRRITGYLVGTLDHWNDAKAAEEKDRVKHGVEEGPEKIERL